MHELLMVICGNGNSLAERGISVEIIKYSVFEEKNQDKLNRIIFVKCQKCVIMLE